MARVLRPGFAFAVVCDRGFIVGLHTHRDKLMGYLIWLSRNTYDQMPTVDDARAVTDWRWCVFYPLARRSTRTSILRSARLTSRRGFSRSLACVPAAAHSPGINMTAATSPDLAKLP
jgi:hypothetical protein